MNWYELEDGSLVNLDMVQKVKISTLLPSIKYSILWKDGSREYIKESEFYGIKHELIRLRKLKFERTEVLKESLNMINAAIKSGELDPGCLEGVKHD